MIERRCRRDNKPRLLQFAGAILPLALDGPGASRGSQGSLTHVLGNPFPTITERITAPSPDPARASATSAGRAPGTRWIESIEDADGTGPTANLAAGHRRPHVAVILRQGTRRGNTLTARHRHHRLRRRWIPQGRACFAQAAPSYPLSFFLHPFPFSMPSVCSVVALCGAKPAKPAHRLLEAYPRAPYAPSRCTECSPRGARMDRPLPTCPQISRRQSVALVASRLGPLAIHASLHGGAWSPSRPTK